MLDDRTFYRLVAQIRKNFTWSPQYRAVSNRCKVSDNIKQCEGCDCLIDYGNYNDDYSSFYENIKVGEEEVPVYFEKFHVDHIDPVGSFKNNKSLDYAVERIFCPIDNLMGICMSCHYLKTRMDNVR